MIIKDKKIRTLGNAIVAFVDYDKKTDVYFFRVIIAMDKKYKEFFNKEKISYDEIISYKKENEYHYSYIIYSRTVKNDMINEFGFNPMDFSLITLKDKLDLI